jgi:hypothetical protein
MIIELLLGLTFFFFVRLFATFFVGGFVRVHQRLGRFPTVFTFVFLLEASLTLYGEASKGNRLEEVTAVC